MARLPQIPAITGDIPDNIARVLQSMKEILEVRSGQRDAASGDRFITKDEFEAAIVWQVPVLVNSWVNFGSGYNNAGYTKDRVGVVHLRGRIKSGTLPGSAFILPVGYRPINDNLFGVESNSAYGMVWIKSSGEVYVNNGSNVSVSLDGIVYLPA
jgi:hypothetical protein